MSRIVHRRILASAGSGKTFRLAGRIIGLLREGADPRTILASTFTRAAAAEIRDRVLVRLAKGVLEPERRAELAEGGAPPVTAAEAQALLEAVARDPDRLQVRTLDSFFAASVTAFAAELGLPAELRLAASVEERALVQEAIGAILAGDRAEDIFRTLEALTAGHAGGAIAAAIGRAVTEVAGISRDALPDAWRWDGPPAPARRERDGVAAAFQGLVPTGQKKLDKALETAAASLRDASLTDFEAWRAICDGVVIQRIVDGSRMFDRKPLPDQVIAVGKRAVACVHAAAFAEYARRTELTGSLAMAFDRAFAEAKRRAGAVTFDDLVHAVADAAAQPGNHELFFRLDAQVDHLLLDEFQDTSALQWRALRPLVDELVAGGDRRRSLFVVGDLKQSIYGWRGALPEILERLPETLHADLADERLDVSYRSAQTVLDAVDEVFSGLDGNPAVQGDAACVAAAGAWKASYAPHTAHRPDGAGRAELHLVEKGLELERAADLVQEILRDAPQASVGVLARRNTSVTTLLNLLHQRGVPASARGKGSLQDAAAVNAILAALTLADHPDDTVASFHVGRSPLGPIVGVGPDDHRDHRTGQRRAASAALRAVLEGDGFGESVRRWTNELLEANAVDARESARLATLVEAVTAAESAGSRDRLPRRPIDMVDALRAAEVVESGASRVSVMTIHQSKGLEFDAVVLCDLDLAFADRFPFLAERSGFAGPFARIVRRPSKELAPVLPEWADLLQASRETGFREFLCTLYVALTRASRLLAAVARVPSKGEFEKGDVPRSFGGLLRSAWAPGVARAGLAWWKGDRAAALADRAAPISATSAESSQAAEPIALQPPAGLRALRTASASLRTAGSGAGRAPGTAAARARGIALHAMLEAIGFGDEPWPSEAELLSRARQALAESGERGAEGSLDELQAWLRARLATEELRQALARPAEGGSLRREWRFLRLDRDARIEEGVVDRLVLHGPAGSPSAATVIDFKTGAVAADEIAGRALSYEPQLERYRIAVAERFGIAAEAVRTAVAFVDAGRVVEVGGSGTRV